MTNKSTKKSFLIILITIIILTMGLFCLTACNFNSDKPDNNDYAPKLYTRAATLNDINISMSEEFSFSMNYKITPKFDIDNLQITFMYYDGNNKVIATKIKSVGNVKANTQYSVTVSLTEFSFSDIFKLHSTRAKVSGGTVSYYLY